MHQTGHVNTTPQSRPHNALTLNPVELSFFSPLAAGAPNRGAGAGAGAVAGEDVPDAAALTSTGVPPNTLPLVLGAIAGASFFNVSNESDGKAGLSDDEIPKLNPPVAGGGCFGVVDSAGLSGFDEKKLGAAGALGAADGLPIPKPVPAAFLSVETLLNKGGRVGAGVTVPEAGAEGG